MNLTNLPRWGISAPSSDARNIAGGFTNSKRYRKHASNVSGQENERTESESKKGEETCPQPLT